MGINSIKKVDISKIFSEKNSKKSDKYKEIVDFEKSMIDDDLAQRYLNMDPVDNWSDSEPATAQEISKFINNLKKNAPVGVQISILSRMIALPYVKMLDGEGIGWAAAGSVQEGPDTIQYNLLHEFARQRRADAGLGNSDYAMGSCAQAVATVLISIYDPNFPITNPVDQETYLRSNPDLYQYSGTVEYNQKWEGVNPGDVLISETIDGHKHIMLCVGVSDGNPLIFEAAATRDGFSMYPIVTERTINNDAFGRDYHIFRPTGGETNNGLNDNYSPFN